jgi:hypothetical protein
MMKNCTFQYEYKTHRANYFSEEAQNPQERERARVDILVLKQAHLLLCQECNT